jgi:hypothetical protein
VGEVGTAEGAGRGRCDARERGVPAGAVVHTLFPGVHDGRQGAPAEVPPVQEIPVPGREPGIHPGEEAARPGQPRVGTVRGAPAARPAVEERQKSGLGKYASRGTEGLKTMCGIRPSPHCASSSVSSSVCARSGDRWRRPIAMNAESQDHWCGYSPWDGTVEVPVQLASSTRAALTCSECVRAAGPYTTLPEAVTSPRPEKGGEEMVRTGFKCPVLRAVSCVARSTEDSPKTYGRPVRQGLP